MPQDDLDFRFKFGARNVCETDEREDKNNEVLAEALYGISRVCQLPSA